jgi:hypothetical protein
MGGKLGDGSAVGLVVHAERVLDATPGRFIRPSMHFA